MRRIGDEPGVARQYDNLATVYQDIGDMAEALQYHHKDLAITERVDDRHNAAISYFNLGTLYRDLGELEQARAHYEKVRPLFEVLVVKQWRQQAAHVLNESQVEKTRISSEVAG